MCFALVAPTHVVMPVRSELIVRPAETVVIPSHFPAPRLNRTKAVRKIALAKPFLGNIWWRPLWFCHAGFSKTMV